ncbi:hypothetical protein V6N13_004164 [Hibiscus sabdariffa]
MLDGKIAPKWQESCMQCSSAQILLMLIRHTTLLFVYVLLQHQDAATYYGFLNILMVKSASRNSETNGARNKYRKRKPVFRNP